MIAPDSQRTRSVFGSSMAVELARIDASQSTTAALLGVAHDVLRAIGLPGTRPFGLRSMKGFFLICSNLIDLISYGTCNSSRIRTT